MSPGAGARLQAGPIHGAKDQYFASGTTLNISLLSTTGVDVTYSILCSIHVTHEIGWGASSRLHLF